jgi:hypothetical protein
MLVELIQKTVLPKQQRNGTSASVMQRPPL